MQLKAVLALLAAAGATMAQQFSINTPTTSIIACVPLLLSWTGGAGPYTLIVHTYAGSPGPVVETIPNVSGTSYTYTPKASEVGQQLEFELNDSTGAVAQSGGTPAVLANSQCSGSSSSAAGSSSAAPSSSSAAGGAGSSSAHSSSQAPHSSSAAPSSSSAAPSSSSEAHSSSAAPSSSSEAQSSSAAPSSSSEAHSSAAHSSSAPASSSAPSSGPAAGSSTESSKSGAGSLRVPAAVAGFVGLAAAALL